MGLPLSVTLANEPQIAATIIGIVVAVGLALLTQPEWLLDFLPTRRIGPNLIVNGSFETGEFLVTNLRDRSVSHGAGDNVIEGWLVACSSEKIAWIWWHLVCAPGLPSSFVPPV